MIYFHPIHKKYIWGTESWEISDDCIAANGRYQGHPLKEFFPCPILIKIIDARENLSIQVHPQEKNEMWYFLKSGSAIAGFKEGKDRNSIVECLEKKELPKALKQFDLQKGDALYVPAGTVHSLLAGCHLLEVQQNCNTTYRLYDWERPRPLHIKEALSVMDYHPKKDGIILPFPIQEVNGITWEQILKTPHFTIERITTSIPWKCSNVNPFQIFFLLQGDAFISSEKLFHQRACLCLDQDISITPVNSCQFLRIYI